MTVGPFVWNLFNFSMFFCAIFTLPRLTENQKCQTYLYTAMILATTQMSMQFNPVVAYLFLFAFTLLERGETFLGDHADPDLRVLQDIRHFRTGAVAVLPEVLA